MVKKGKRITPLFDPPPKRKLSKATSFKERKIRGLQYYFWRGYTEKSNAAAAAVRARKRGEQVRVKMGRGRMKGAYLVYSTMQHGNSSTKPVRLTN